MMRIWNWKTALASGLYRTPAFFLVSLRAGWQAAVQAGAAEFLLFGLLSGLTGAAVQRWRRLRPAWLARLLILGLLPASVHTTEYLWHVALGTPARRRGLLVSLGLSVISEAFTWHVMSHGAMLAGAGGDSLFADLRRMPNLLRGFVLSLSRR